MSIEDTLRILREYCDYPGTTCGSKVAEMVNNSLAINDITRAAQTNNEAFSTIGKKSCEIVAHVIKRLHMTEHLVIAESKIEALQANLRDIKHLVEKHIQRRGFIQRIFHYFASEAKIIRECRSLLHDCDNIEHQYTEEIIDIMSFQRQYIEEILDEMLQHQLQEPLGNQRSGSLAQMSITSNTLVESSVNGPYTSGEAESTGGHWRIPEERLIPASASSSSVDHDQSVENEVPEASGSHPARDVAKAKESGRVSRQAGGNPPRDQLLANTVPSSPNQPAGDMPSTRHNQVSRNSSVGGTHKGIAVYISGTGNILNFNL